MTKTVFIPHEMQNVDFLRAGYALNFDPAVKSDFVYSMQDSLASFDAVEAYGIRHGVATRSRSLCDKGAAYNKFLAAGFVPLDTVLVNSRDDIENFGKSPAILKPTVSADMFSGGHKLDSIMYRVLPTAELLSLADGLGAFNDGEAVDPFILQQAADGSSDNYEALILSGAVNGQGNVWHFAPITLDTYFKDKVRKVKSVWSSDNTTDYIQELQANIERLLSAENSKNCFYQLQFLRSGQNWAPHDFQFRFTYYAQYYLGMSPYADFKTAMIKYAFDGSTEKPNMPMHFGLKVTPASPPAPTTMPPKKHFIAAASSAEVREILEGM